MNFSKKSQYALRALIELTGRYGRSLLQRHEIAARQRIPIEFLEQILLSLKNAGFLASRRGVGGGYSLIKSPHEITLGQVIRVLDGPLAPISCVSKTAYQKCEDCPYADNDTKNCPIQRVMLDVRNAIADILDNYRLSDFVKQTNYTRPPQAPSHPHSPSRPRPALGPRDAPLPGRHTHRAER
jgi:Rrf2 family cysteine metabolism transcriptional repressor